MTFEVHIEGIDVLERMAIAFEGMAAAQQKQADILERSYVGPANLPTGEEPKQIEAPPADRPKRNSKKKDAAQPEAPVQGNVEILEETGVKTIEEDLLPGATAETPKQVTRDMIIELCKQLFAKDGGKRERPEAILRKHSGGKVLVKDIEPEHFPVIYRDLKAILQPTTGDDF